MSVALGLDKQLDRHSFGSRFLLGNGFSDLLELELNQLILLITVGMVLGENPKSLFLLTFTDEPSRGLLNEKDETKLDGCGYNLY